MPIKNIEKIVDLPEISHLLDDHEKLHIVDTVLNRFYEDKKSQEPWMEKCRQAIELASLDCSKKKTTPFIGASDVKYPAIALATTQFAARTMPEIVRGSRLVEMHAAGQDPEGLIAARAKNAAEYMTHQLIYSSNEWQDSTDRLLNLYSNIGTAYRKVTYDTIRKKIVFHLCKYDEIFVNNEVSSIEDAVAVTHIYGRYQNEIISDQRAGIYANVEITKDDTGSSILELEDDELHEVLEQHCLLDLDNDGYEEPYIVSIHTKTQKLLRLVARYFKKDIIYNKKKEIVRIKPINLFIDYHFLHSMDGTFYSLGFGSLLAPLNHTINSLINQLSDAGKLANMQGGLISKQLRLKSGNMMFSPGEWKVLESVGPTNIKDNVYPLSYKEPSSTLFALLQLLIGSTKEVASLSDVLQGMNRKHNEKATAVMEAVNQGLTLHTAIVKRLYTSLKKEFELIYRLNAAFVTPEEYARVLNIDPSEITAEDGTVIDFNLEDLDISPVADPNMSSESKRNAQSELLLNFINNPVVDQRQLIMRVLSSADIPGLEQLLPEPDGKPDPQSIALSADIANKAGLLEVKKQQLELKAQELTAKSAELQSRAIKNIADAEGVSAGIQIDTYKANLEQLNSEVNLAKVLNEVKNNDAERADRELEQGPDNNKVEEEATE
jgi:hypothetical protein